MPNESSGKIFKLLPSHFTSGRSFMVQFALQVRQTVSLSLSSSGHFLVNLVNDFSTVTEKLALRFQ